MTFPEGEFFIQNVFSGLVLDVKDGSVEEGAPIILWERKESDNDNQLWRYENGFLINRKSGRCLTVKGVSGGGQIRPGTFVVQTQRREPPTSINQLWASNYDYLMPYDPKVCLSARDDRADKGAEMVVDMLIDFPNNVRQQWMFIEK
ncbi:RICIN domain-containing protein [Nocardia sp. NPDC052566]|uniref:RICIN domain-containing protein n=1 Tax=Nocardia sp. NPDC052566 TaxID=3364330 RepID=UPI0037C82AA1